MHLLLQPAFLPKLTVMSTLKNFMKNSITTIGQAIKVMVLLNIGKPLMSMAFVNIIGKAGGFFMKTNQGFSTINLTA